MTFLFNTTSRPFKPTYYVTFCIYFMIISIIHPTFYHILRFSSQNNYNAFPSFKIGIEGVAQDFIEEVYYFLENHGYINFGIQGKTNVT